MDILRIGNTLLANINGKSFNKCLATNSDASIKYDELKLADSEELALSFFAPEKSSKQLELEYEYKEKIEASKLLEDILDFMKDVKTNGHALFEVKENSLYLKGISISIPELLVRKILQADEVDDTQLLNSLINFWTLCAMNPDGRARHDLFKFLGEGKFTITPSGYFVGYRNVNIKNSGNKKLHDAISHEWSKRKRQKKAPNNYDLYLLEDGSYTSARFMCLNVIEEIGNLHNLYNNINQVTETEYTDAHTQSMKIRLGEAVKMPRADCNGNPNETCSAG